MAAGDHQSRLAADCVKECRKNFRQRCAGVSSAASSGHFRARSAAPELLHVGHGASSESVGDAAREQLVPSGRPIP